MKTKQRIDISKSPSADRLQEVFNMYGVTGTEAALGLIESGQQSIEWVGRHSWWEQVARGSYPAW